MNKIKLDLFQLKDKEDLVSVQKFFQRSSADWFTDDGSPNAEYFEFRSCLFCGQDDSSELYNIEGFCYHRCLACDSIYTKPHLKEGVLNKLYTDGTYQQYQDKLVKKSSKLRKGVLELRKFQQISSLLNKENVSLLDVGCGGGTFLDNCIENGWSAEGVDPSEESSSASGAHIWHGDFSKMAFSKKFDVITFWGVLEHLSDPIAALSKATSLLNDAGMIVFEVPSANCFISEYLKKSCFAPTRYIESGRHNIFFSKNLIEKVAIDFGLEIALIETNGLDLQTIFIENFDSEITEKILNMQDTLNELLLGDHYRVFLKKIEF